MNVPRLIFWESTAGCNLRCRHCRRLDVMDAVTEQDITTTAAKAMLNDIAKHYKPILVFSGGEPLFRQDIFELASHAVALGMKAALATNGTLVDGTIADKIKKSGISRISISLDGVIPVTHDTFRGLPGSFAKAVSGIQLLKARGLSVQVNFSGAKHNIKELPELYKFCLDLGLDAMHLFMLVPVGCGVTLEDGEMLSSEEYEEWLEWLWLKSQEGKLEIKATCAPHYYRIMRQKKTGAGDLELGTGSRRLQPAHFNERRINPAATSRERGDGMGKLTKGCLAGTGVCFISHKGDVFPCGYLPLTAGNVLESSFKDIWDNSSVFERLRKSELLGGKCGLCSFRYVCGGCRARAFSATGDELAEEPYCAYQPEFKIQNAKRKVQNNNAKLKTSTKS